MVQKVKIINDMATFMCPECIKAKTVNVSNYKSKDIALTVKCKCPCGHTFTVLLDRRQCNRQNFDANGIFIRYQDGKEVAREIMAISDLSYSGLKFSLNKQRDFRIGEKILVVIKLDDNKNTTIKKEVIVRTMNDLNVGGEFLDKQSEDIEPFLNRSPVEKPAFADAHTG